MSPSCARRTSCHAVSNAHCVTSSSFTLSSSFQIQVYLQQRNRREQPVEFLSEERRPWCYIPCVTKTFLSRAGTGSGDVTLYVKSQDNTKKGHQVCRQCSNLVCKLICCCGRVYSAGPRRVIPRLVPLDERASEAPSHFSPPLPLLPPLTPLLPLPPVHPLSLSPHPQCLLSFRLCGLSVALSSFRVSRLVPVEQCQGKDIQDGTLDTSLCSFAPWKFSVQ